MNAVQITLQPDFSNIQYGKFHYPQEKLDVTLFSSPQQAFEYAYNKYGNKLLMISGEMEDMSYFEYSHTNNGKYNIYTNESYKRKTNDTHTLHT